MRFSVFALAAACAAVVSAQTTHTVLVGDGGGLTYSPANFTAAVGDTVTFEFRSKNHTVSQSTFADPCSLLVNATSGASGISSGYRAVAANATAFPTWSIQITQTAPIWLFCEQTGHCAKGMVGSINAVETGPNNFGAFQAKAMSTATATGSSTGSAAATGSGTAAGGATNSASGTASAASGTSTSNAAVGGKAVNTVLLSVAALALGIAL